LQNLMSAVFALAISLNWVAPGAAGPHRAAGHRHALERGMIDPLPGRFGPGRSGHGNAMGLPHGGTHSWFHQGFGGTLNPGWDYRFGPTLGGH
jgi:hypothetical protein